MLVLTLKVGEKIVSDDIEFKVLSVQGYKIKVGVTAARSKPIHRGEVLDRLATAQAAASQDGAA